MNFESIKSFLTVFSFGFLALTISCSNDNDLPKSHPLPDTPPDLIPYNSIGSGKISFQRHDFTVSGGEISFNARATYVIDIGTQTSRALSEIEEPVLSPDGKSILHVKWLSRCRWGIQIANTDGSNDQSFSNLDNSAIYPSWNDEANQILFFDSDLGLLYSQLVHATQVDRKVIYDFGYVWSDSDPTQRPSNIVLTPFSVSNSGKIIFCQRIDSLNKEAIFSTDISGANLNRLFLTDEFSTAVTVNGVNGTAQNLFSPRWSPDGHTIAFILFSGPGYLKYQEIVLIDATGDNKHSIIKFDIEHKWWHNTGGFSTMCWRDFRRRDISLCWSPDGTKIIFTKLEPENDSGLTRNSIYLINSDGTDLVQVTSKGDASDGHVSWSK